MLLKKLTEAAGVSGGEQEIRSFIVDTIKTKVDDVKIDSLGNIIAYKKGKKMPDKKIMLTAHMDEVGLIVVGIEDSGLIKFKTVGGIDSRILLSKTVYIGEDKVLGVIGAKPIHLQEKEEKEKVLTIKNLYIDIGAKNKEESESLIRLGDYIIFDSKYIEFGNGFIKAKALDDRVGCDILIQMLDEEYDFTLYAVFTVQEEVGLRGAKVASYGINPDLALVVEGTTCSDVPGSKSHEYATRLGKGPAISIMDAASYSDKKVVKTLFQIGKDHTIPIQYKKTTFGGNDSGAIHLTKSGIRTAAISIPCRYIHSPSSVMSKNDYLSGIKIIKLFLEKLEREDV